MKNLIWVILIINLFVSCILMDQNFKRKDIENGNIPLKTTDYGTNYFGVQYTYAGDFSHFFSIIIGIENTYKWKIFYENDEYIYYGKLLNKNIISNLYHLKKSNIMKYIPLYKNENISEIINNNIINYIRENKWYIEDSLNIKTVEIIGMNIDGTNENIKYQFEIIGEHYAPRRMYKLNIVALMDMDLNVLECYYLNYFR